MLHPTAEPPGVLVQQLRQASPVMPSRTVSGLGGEGAVVIEPQRVIAVIANRAMNLMG